MMRTRKDIENSKEQKNRKYFEKNLRRQQERACNQGLIFTSPSIT